MYVPQTHHGTCIAHRYLSRIPFRRYNDNNMFIKWGPVEADMVANGPLRWWMLHRMHQCNVCFETSHHTTPRHTTCPTTCVCVCVCVCVYVCVCLGRVLTGGSYAALLDLMPRWTGRRVLYIGDQLQADLQVSCFPICMDA